MARRLPPPLARAGVAVVAFLAVVPTRLAGPASPVLSHLALVGATAVAALACLRAARRDDDGRAPWACLAAAAVTWGLGEATFGALELAGDELPFPSVADVGYLAAVPLAAAGLVLLVRRDARRLVWVTSVLDGWVAVGSLLFLSWTLVLVPAYEGSDGDLLARAIALAYPVGDLALVAVAIVGASRARGPHRVRCSVIAAAFVAFAIGDSGFAVLAADGSYTSGTWTDAGWMGAFALLAAAAALPPGPRRDAPPPPSALQLTLPYVPVAVTVLVGVTLLAGGREPRAVPVAILTGIVLLTLVRQMVAVLGNHALAQALDRHVQALREREQELHHRASHDPLTGLANRALLVERVEDALARQADEGGDLSLLYVDLDGFKQVNDTLGHAAGDAVLVEVADRLRASARRDDTVARVGGDEYVVLLDRLGVDGARVVATRLLDALRAPVAIDGDDVVVPASVGISTAGRGTTADELLRQGDLAMYGVKVRTGAAADVFRGDLAAGGPDRRRTAAELLGGLRRGELVLHHQPVVSLATGRVDGVEALLRWRHPERGLLSAAAFVDAAEEAGAMLEVGRWALFEACGQLASWRREGRRVERIAVNVAAEQLDSGRLADDVFDALAAAGVPASSLVLELTERQLLDGAEVVDAQLHLLAAQGVQLALDDFGTGWSSLGYLTRVPVTQLKIDKLFIERVVQDGPDRLVVDAICRVATGLGLTTVAEGVERPDQLAVARALGVTAAQGYLLSHPVPADEVAPLLGSTLVGAPGLLPGGPGRGPAAIRG